MLHIISVNKGTGMLTHSTRWSGVIALLLALTSSIANAYDYPFKDPYVATILGTPPEYAFKPDAEVPLKNDTITMFPERAVPEVFWYLGELHYSYLQQKEAAPLIFLIAGTGASYHSPKMLALQRAFFQIGRASCRESA